MCNTLLKAPNYTKFVITAINQNNSHALSILIKPGVNPLYNNKSGLIEAVKKIIHLL
jgi:hypothetical protein